MIKTKHFRFGMPLLMALLAVFVTTDTAQAQAMMHDHESMGVAISNESDREVRVYAFPDNIEDRVMLGWVGGGELEYFPVPDEARTESGSYRIAVQPILPLPQIGVDASPHPMEVTPTLVPDPMETVRLVVDDQMELTFTIIS